ncbi:protease complex subunit PrcB family protein [Pseudoduganella albidiflava]|nr:protease complex subunit PrcB family protein [Pseudoduganella albidiflava]
MRPYRSAVQAAALLLTALSLAACGGGGPSSSPTSAVAGGKGIAVGEPAPGAPAREEFIAQARKADCAEQRNRLFIIDNELVLWDRAGNCADMSWNATLYRLTPGAMLCTAGDTIAGPRTTCTDERYRALLETAAANLAKDDLGLGGAHKVEVVPFIKDGTLPFAPLVQDQYSGIAQPRNVVVRDRAGLETLWNAHYLGRSPVPPLPEVDFQRSMVVGVFAGSQAAGCQSAAVATVEGDNGKVVVGYEISTLMTVAPCAQALGAPMALAVVDRYEGEVAFVDTTPEHMAFTSLDLEDNSAVATPETVVVRDAAAWNELWARHKSRSVPVLPVPQVDFNRYMVIGVFIGSRPNGCFKTTVTDVYRSGRKIHVTRVDHQPDPRAVCTQALTTPSHLIMVERSDLPVVVSSHTVT